MDTHTILRIVLTVLMVLACGSFGVFTVKYFVDYKIFQYLYAKLRGRAQEADRIRRLQMRETFKGQSSIMDETNKKPSLIDRIYKQISMTGVTTILPGFSESIFIILFVVTGLAIFSLLAFKMSFAVALVGLAGYAIVVTYILSIVIYTRRIKVESQLLDFVNQVSSVSRQYSNISDIIGSIYEEFQQPLSGAMETCYVESKQLKNTELAISHMKDKFDSVQFEFVMDNLLLCSKATGDYAAVSQDLSKTVSIYLASHEKKQALLRNAKITLCVMFALGLVACFALGEFVGGVDQLFSSTGGQIIAILLIVLFFYGLNLKAE